MNKLFIKIYGWFLLTILLVSSALIFVTISSIPYPPPRGLDPTQPSNRFVRQNLHRTLQSITDIYESDGREAMQKELNRYRQLKNIYIFEINGKQLTNHPSIPPEVERIKSSLANSRRMEFHESSFVGFKIGPPPRNRYLCVFNSEDLFKIRARLGFLNRFRASAYDNLTGEMALGLLAVLLISGILCFFMARHLTTPITRLRSATREITDGNLSSRIGQGIGNRNDELADLSRDFDLMAEQIEKLLNSQSRLIRDISHELRSPLARLNVALELARGSSPDSSAPALDRIEKESQLLNEMVEQLLTLSRMESGITESLPADFDLGEMLSDIAGDASFESKNRKIEVRLHKEDAVIISGYEDLLHSALENIVRNALVYTRDNSSVDISMKTINHDRKKLAEIKIRDHGKGIPEPELEKIFHPFYRLAQSRDRKSGGTGIGLAISERAVKIHKGRIRAENHSQGGLLFTVLLPCQEPTSSA